MKNVLLGTIITISILVFIKIITYPNFKKLKDKLNIESKYPNEVDWKITYSSDVKYEKMNGIYFAKGLAKKARIYSGILNLSREINEADTKRLVEILNDSTSYDWGEIGTFELDKSIIFYDKDEKEVGVTQFDVSHRQTYSFPFLRTMKWGFLSYKGRDEIYEIIDK